MIDEAVHRRELVGGELLAHVEHRVEGLAVVLGEARALLQRGDVQPVVEQEIGGLARRWSWRKGSLGIPFGLTCRPFDNPGRTERFDRTQADQSTSNTPAAPMPPPMHMVTHHTLARTPPPSMSAWPVRRWPLMP